MEYRNFGTAGLKVSRICLGTAFRAAPDEATCRTTLERALDLGVNFLDCANAYRGGRSECILGDALQGRRDQYVITTKVQSPMGSGPNDRGLSRIHILREVERSLTRLRTDYIDVYLLHAPDAGTPIEETLCALEDLVRQGKVRYTGCCNYDAWQVCQALRVCDRCRLTPYIAVQNHYNLLDRSIERELLPFCRDAGLGVMTYSPLAVGLLSGLVRHGQPPPPGSPWAEGRPGFRELLTPAADAVVAELIRIGADRGKTPAQVAIAWILSHAEISAAMIGPDTPDQVVENLGGVGWELAPEERAALDAISAPCQGWPK